jgi:NitT/TauT family transport system substrate-binding protein
MTLSLPIGRRAVLITGTGLSLAAPHIARAADALTVRCDFAPWGIQAAMHVAQVKGWFREADLTVDVQDGRGSGNTLQLVNAGQVDVGQIAVGLLPQARDNGATVRSIACFGRKTDLAVMVDADGPCARRRISAARRWSASPPRPGRRTSTPGCAPAGSTAPL